MSFGGLFNVLSTPSSLNKVNIHIEEKILNITILPSLSFLILLETILQQLFVTKMFFVAAYCLHSFDAS